MRSAFLLACLVSTGIAAWSQNCEVLRYDTEIEITAGKNKITESILVRVNNASGNDFNPIRIYYSDKEPVSGISVQIETVDGRLLHKVRNNEMRDESAISSASFYEDHRVRKIPVNHNSYPYCVRYTYTRQYREFMTIARWDPYPRYSVPVNEAVLSVSVPAGYPVSIHDQFIRRQEEVLAGGGMKYTWKVSDLPEFREEALSPDPRDVLPSVLVVPGEFKLGVPGSFSTWKAFGNWVYRLNKGRLDLTAEEKVRVQQMIGGLDDEREKVRILYHHLQDFTRYINVTIDIGGFQTYPASYVCKNAYGDCKALSNYMVALLEYAGISAHYALVYADKKPPLFLENMPSNQFNHAIVCVPLKGDTLWLECTDKYVPFGYTGSFIQGRPALLIDESESRLVRIPCMESSRTGTTRTYDIVYSRYAQSEVAMKAVLKGDDFKFVRYMNSEIHEKDKGDYLEYYLRVPEAEVIGWSVEDQDRDSDSLVLVARMKAGRFVSHTGNLAVIRPPSIGIPDMDEPGKRKWPVYLASPYRQADTLRLSCPPNAEYIALPKDTLLSGPYGSYARTLDMEPGKVVLVREFEFPVQRLAQGQYPEFYRFLESVKSLESEKILFKNP